MPIKTDKCLICKTQVQDAFWVYLWKQKQGFCCSECGKAIHNAGYKILDSISEILSTNGVQYIDSKEKFGYYQLYATVDTPDQLNLAKALFDDAEKRFFEFSFSFNAYLRHTNKVAR